MKIRHIAVLPLLILLMTSVMFGNSVCAYTFSSYDPIEITSIDISVTSPLCGTRSGSKIEWFPYLASGKDYIDIDSSVEIIKTQWMTVEKKDKKNKKDKEEKSVPFYGSFSGGKKYRAYISFKLKNGFSFASGLNKKKIRWGAGIENENIIELKEDMLTFTCDIKCIHDKDVASSVITDATCISPGKEKYHCLGCGQEVVETGKINPNAHNWNDWTVLTPATTLIEGSRKHTCKYCQKEETVCFPRIYSHVYEPETSWTMSATVAWPSDGHVLEAAKADVRPQVAFVWPDKDLKIYDRNGDFIKESIEEYVRDTASSMIPAFYIKDPETAEALKEWLRLYGLKDCFVVGTPGTKDLVRDVADLVQVRGMLDYSIFDKFSRHDLADMNDALHQAHGRVIILGEKAATKENIKTLQSLGNSVWVKTSDDLKTIMTFYTQGVNGIVTEDYVKALNAVSFFNDDEPTLLRKPFIIGHRGDPSNYAENTLESAKGACSEGADAVENDVHITKDGEVVIKHDSTLELFTGLDDVLIRNKTLNEIKALSLVWDGQTGIRSSNEVNANNRTYGKFYGGKLFGEAAGYEYKIPALREYFEEFKDDDLVHVIELKSYDQKTMKVVSDLINEYDLRDRVMIITFGKNTMKAMYDNYPYFSLGALGVSISGYGDGYPYKTYKEVCESEGAEAALERLSERLDRWNASLNITDPDKTVVKAGRHRGLTAWPWTYTLPYDAEELAEDYRFGMNGLTVDQPWAFSDFIEEIRAEDVTAENIKDVPKPVAVTRTGDEKILDKAEIKIIKEAASPEGSALAVWRYKEKMMVDGIEYGKYYLYSNPFTLKILKSDINETEEEAEEVIPEERSPVPWILTGIAVLTAAAAAAAVVLHKKKDL
ncbi:MAG: hypothetical protein K5643_02355 [Saccharofermentans sp.]|nr:hypothetical protein [Saccharofermentans sp.]